MDRTRARRNPRRGYTGAKENLFGQPCRNGPNGPNGHRRQARAGTGRSLVRTNGPGTRTDGPDGRTDGRTGERAIAAPTLHRSPVWPQESVYAPNRAFPRPGRYRPCTGLLGALTGRFRRAPSGTVSGRRAVRSVRAVSGRVRPFGRRTVGPVHPFLPSGPTGRTLGVAREAFGRCTRPGARLPGLRPSRARTRGGGGKRVPGGVERRVPFPQKIPPLAP